MIERVQVYLSSQYQTRHLLRSMRTNLERDGVVVQARWIDTDTEKSWDLWSEKEKRATIQMDLDDLTAADIVVFFSSKAQHGWGTGGRHVEVGYALAIGKPVLLVGEPENLFHFHERVTVVPWVGDLSLTILAEYYKLRESKNVRRLTC